MKRRLFTIILLTTISALTLFVSSCFGNTSLGGSSPTPGEVVKPKPSIGKVTAATDGTQTGYYVTLNIPVTNDGAKGTILVIATVTQAGQTQQQEFSVFLKQGETHETELTFPLKWKGGDFTPSVQCQLP